VRKLPIVAAAWPVPHLHPHPQGRGTRAESLTAFGHCCLLPADPVQATARTTHGLARERRRPKAQCHVCKGERKRLADCSQTRSLTWSSGRCWAARASSVQGRSPQAGDRPVLPSKWCVGGESVESRACSYGAMQSLGHLRAVLSNGILRRCGLELKPITPTLRTSAPVKGLGMEGQGFSLAINIGPGSGGDAVLGGCP